MDYNYSFTALAEQDIDEALNYITSELCNAKAAMDLLQEIERSINNIVAFPFAATDCKIF